MGFEVTAGTHNVVRFPVELRARPTMGLLRAMAPDVREVVAVAESFGLEAASHDLRDRTDAETAVHIAVAAPRFGPERGAMLTALVDQVVEAAVSACRRLHCASAAAAEARGVLERAVASRGLWLAPLRERSAGLSMQAAELLIEAHARSEEAEGVARAVDFARRSAAWSPRDQDAEFEALILARSGD